MMDGGRGITHNARVGHCIRSLSRCKSRVLVRVLLCRGHTICMEGRVLMGHLSGAVDGEHKLRNIEGGGLDSRI